MDNAENENQNQNQNQTERDDGGNFLKISSLPLDWQPVAEDESKAFRSLDMSESDDDGEGFLKKVPSLDKYVPEVEDESKGFRSLGARSEDDEREDDDTKAEKEKMPKRVDQDKEEIIIDMSPPPHPFGFGFPQPKSAVSSPVSSSGERSSGISLVVSCACCECCPYHKAVEEGAPLPKSEASTKEKSSRSNVSKRRTKKRTPVEQKRKQSRRRVQSAEAIKKTRKIETRKRSRSSQIIRNLFAGLLSNDANDEYMRFVCAGFADKIADVFREFADEIND